MESEVFKAYSQYYNLLYAEKQYEAEAAYIRNTILRYQPGAKTILEYGSGTGRHGLLLQQMGFSMSGVERSRDMAAIARANGYNCDVADILEYEPGKTFDVCIALFHVISYVNADADLTRLFTKTRHALKPGGIFVFDVWYTPAVLHQKPESRVKKVEDDEIEVTRYAEPVVDNVRHIVTVNYEIEVKQKSDGEVTHLKESHPMRHFDIPEISALGGKTGFTLLKAEEFLTSADPSVNTWGVNFILQAR